MRCVVFQVFLWRCGADKERKETRERRRGAGMEEGERKEGAREGRNEETKKGGKEERKKGRESEKEGKSVVVGGRRAEAAASQAKRHRANACGSPWHTEPTASTQN